jgi:AP endonuclease-1
MSSGTNHTSGKIGLDAFRLVMRDSRLQHIPLVLETPGGKENREMEIYAAEIELLYEIQKIEDDQWLEKRVGIEQRWRGVRDGICPPVIKAPKGKKAKVAKDSPDSTSE